MTCAWVENTINDSLILGLWKGKEGKNTFQRNTQTHSLSFTCSGLTHVIFILQPPRNVLLNYKPKMRGVKAFCPITLSHMTTLCWCAHPTHTLWNCQGHWYNTKAGDTTQFPLALLLLPWVLTRHMSHLWNGPCQFPLFFQDDTMLISNSHFLFMFIKSSQCSLTALALRKHAGPSRVRLGLFLWPESCETWKLLP